MTDDLAKEMQEAAIVDGDGFPVDEADMLLLKGAERIFAHAKLISDMLEALEEVLDGLGFLSGGNHELEGVGISEDRGAEIRAAIAKAKGEMT